MKIKKHCDQCNALVINGIFCHEHGCPNERKTWDAEDGQWLKVFKCNHCGDDVLENELCLCWEEEDDSYPDDEEHEDTPSLDQNLYK